MVGFQFLHNTQDWEGLPGNSAIVSNHLRKIDVDGLRIGMYVAEMLQDAEAIDLIVSNHSIWANNKYSLTLEITAGGLVVDSASNFGNLNRLRNAGISISIDDFDTGYSSLSYFKHIPATELKIDKSFVSNMLESTKGRNLVETIIGLGHQFDMTVVAEGVENTAELELLTKLNCDVVQGYHVSEALPHDSFCVWLAS